MKIPDIHEVKTGNITAYFTAVLPSADLSKIVQACLSLGWEAGIAEQRDVQSVIFFGAQTGLNGAYVGCPRLILELGYFPLRMSAINRKATSKELYKLSQKAGLLIVPQPDDDVDENTRLIRKINHERYNAAIEYGLRTGYSSDQAWMILYYATFLKYARGVDMQDAIIAARRRFG
ncbi:MAG TPA: hypothetical protein VJJ75_02660 [Candidatus Nanoarchaeia archaeon]|nr:hypothetical protein [Candidatus Nanoarchaeia archaeon]